MIKLDGAQVGTELIHKRQVETVELSGAQFEPRRGGTLQIHRETQGQARGWFHALRLGRRSHSALHRTRLEDQKDAF